MLERKLNENEKGQILNRFDSNVKSIIEESETIFVNGTMGRYEDLRFANGTKEFLNMLAHLN